MMGAGIFLRSPSMSSPCSAFNTGAGIITSGALTLVAVAVYSGLQPIRRLWMNIRAAFAQPAAAVKTP